MAAALSWADRLMTGLARWWAGGPTAAGAPVSGPAGPWSGPGQVLALPASLAGDLAVYLVSGALCGALVALTGAAAWLAVVAPARWLRAHRAGSARADASGETTGRVSGGPADPAAGTWWEITPPPALPADGPGAMWRALAGVLRRDERTRGRWSWRRAGGWLPVPVRRPGGRLAVEWWADAAGLRAGVWVAAGMPAGAVAEGLRAAWPGAEVTATDPPAFTTAPAVLDLRPDCGGVWAPLLDPATRPDRATPGGAGVGEPLRAVLDGLTGRAPGEQACVQLVIGAPPDPRAGLAGYRGEGLSGTLALAAPALLGSLAGVLAAAVLTLLDLFGPTTTRTRARTRRPATAGRGAVGASRAGAAGVDPVLIAADKARIAKRVSGPHLRVSLRVAAAIPTTRDNGTGPADGQPARRVASTIAAGFDLITTHTALRPRWARHPRALTGRATGAAFAATVAELGALWHLPADPARHHLSAPGAGQARPDPGATRLTPQTATKP
jgi:hypothetical protein